MNLLEQIRQKNKRVCCNNCKNHVTEQGKLTLIDFCEVSGKMILPMHLDSNREKQCKNKFIGK